MNLRKKLFLCQTSAIQNSMHRSRFQKDWILTCLVFEACLWIYRCRCQFYNWFMKISRKYCKLYMFISEWSLITAVLIIRIIAFFATQFVLIYMWLWLQWNMHKFIYFSTFFSFSLYFRSHCQHEFLTNWVSKILLFYLPIKKL